MSHEITATLDAEQIIRELLTLGDRAEPYINEASKVTADAIVAEARARLERALGPTRQATPSRQDLGRGLTMAGLTVVPSFPLGFSVVDSRDPFANVPLWIELGTKHGEEARNFFYPSAQLEIGAHERRISDALQAAIDAEGLGG